MTLRSFNTTEDMLEAYKKDAEEEYKKTPKSGIFCQCSCYKKFENEKYPTHISTCMLILPKEMYESYTHRRREDVTLLLPGILNVKLDPDERNNYGIKSDLCKNKGKIEYLMNRYLGQEIRLGKNIKIK